MKKIQQIKKRELNEWKKRRQCDIQQEYGACLSNFGAAHMAACDASCEEDDALLQKREENDLLVAQRGRTAMLQEQRRREREAEERLLKKKRKQQKNASVQTNLVTRKAVESSHVKIPVLVPPVDDESNEEFYEDEGDGNIIKVQTFSSKPNLHKSSAVNYNPKNFTSNSVDSSNHYESEDEISTSALDSEEEFNQITNLLKKKCCEHYQAPHEKFSEEPTVLSDSSSVEVERNPPPKAKKKAVPVQTTNKSILKKLQSKTKAAEHSRREQTEKQDLQVKYVDYANKYTKTYVPDDDLVTQNTKTSKSNAMTEARKLKQSVVSDDVLR